MILGINGYARSGKDTVGQIIKDLQPEKNWEIKKFAGKLKQIASLLTNIPEEKMEDAYFKTQALSSEWWTPCDEGLQPMTGREFLQKLGTDALRNGLHTNVWVNALMSEHSKNKNWVVTDVRFPNEAEIIKAKKGVIIRIDRPGVKAVNNHASETGLDNWNFDYKIANVSDKIALKQSVESILKHLNIL
jgi:hypothetical protein